MSSYLRGGACALALTVVLGLHAPVMGQTVATAVEIEGPLKDVDDAANTITVMDIVVSVPDGTPIHSPTANGLTLAQLETGPLPARSQEGFLEGTAIVTGTSLNGVVTATDIFVEPAENVVVGISTSSDPLRVNGMLLRRSPDPRMPAGPPLNAFGFRIVPTSIPIGTLVAAEGYYATIGGNRLIWHTLEADEGTLVNNASREVSIIRAQCRDRGNTIELEVRGGAHDPADAQIRVERRLANGTFQNVGTVAAVPDAATPRFGEYRLRIQNLVAADCPTQVRAVMVAFPTVRATADVDIVVDD